MLSVKCVHEGTAGSDVLRALYSELTTKVDARIVAANMYQRNALTLKELQSIQSLRDRPVEAAEVLLNVIMEQPDAVYLCFLDVLKRCGQQHFYQTLVEGGYKGWYGNCCSILTSSYIILVALPNTYNTNFAFNSFITVAITLSLPLAIILHYHCRFIFFQCCIS